jgi:DNA primase
MLFGSNKSQTNTVEYYSPAQVKEILVSSGITIANEIDSHYLIFCPFHYNINTPACEVDKESGLFICFSCGENGTLIDIVMKTTSRNYIEARRFISSKEKSEDIISSIINKVDAPIDEEYDLATIERLHMNCLNSDRAIEYFESRKINLESVSRLKLGYSDKQDMVTVPIYDVFGKCMGFVARSVEGKDFKNSPGMKKSKTFFNIHNAKFKDIIVVESSFDAIRLIQLGYNAIASLGANISKYQIELLEKYAISIIVIPDNDAAGKEMTDKITSNIFSKDVKVIEIHGGKDIGDLSDSEVLAIFDNV